MSNNTSINITEARNFVRRRLRLDTFRAVLGDVNGVIDEPGRPGYVRVRRYTSDGLGQYEVVRERGMTVRTPNTPVKLGYDTDDELAVIESDFGGQLAQGTNPVLNNPLNQDVYKWAGQSELTTLFCHALTTATTPSTSVAVRAWIYTRHNTIQRFAGAQVDLSSVIPAVGLHRIAVVFVTYANSTEVVASTTKNTLDPIDLTDVQECFDNRTPGSYPVWAWKLADAQTSITENDKWLDCRGILNVDSIDGVDTFALDVTASTLIPANRQLTVQSFTVSGVLQIDGELTVL